MLAVIVPVYNEAAGIGPTLDALEAQTDADFDDLRWFWLPEEIGV